MNVIKQIDELLPDITPGKWTGGGAPQCGYGWVHAEQHIRCTFGQPRQILASQYGAMHADALFIAHTRNNIEALIDAAKVLPQALKLIDAHRRISLGEGDLTAMAIRDTMKRLGLNE